MAIETKTEVLGAWCDICGHFRQAIGSDETEKEVLMSAVRDGWVAFGHTLNGPELACPGWHCLVAASSAIKAEAAMIRDREAAMKPGEEKP